MEASSDLHLGARERETETGDEHAAAMASSDAGTSSGSEYDVFLNFRGPDTRKGFTDVLYHFLNDAGICVFRDDEGLRVGEKIGGSLERAIDNSRVYIPIFSQTYAESKWCLRELARIVDNTSKLEGNKEILPIFLDVKSDDVKNNNGLYAKAIFTHEQNKELSNNDRVQLDAWRTALIKVGGTKGLELEKYKGQGELSKLVVDEVLKMLTKKDRLVTEHLVGIDHQVAAVTQKLKVDSDGVRLVIIHGMGGIGKTTLAQVIFNELSSSFPQCCFIEDVREVSSRRGGLVELQKKLLSKLGVADGSFTDIDDGMKRIGHALNGKNVLIVLDDVDNSQQVKKLVGRGALGERSRVLITTRNRDVLRNYVPNYQILDFPMEMMSMDDALHLFNKHASPSVDCRALSEKIVSATGRLPLALTVFGALLRGEQKYKWERTLEDLSRAPPNDIVARLKISYDALTFEQQHIFLDIACFFIGEDRTNATYMWEDCGVLRIDEVDVLVRMCLIKITENNTFWMHDQIRDLGQEIVRQQNPVYPEKRSRLWIHEKILDAMATDEMKNDVQALDLDLRKSELKDVMSQEIGRFGYILYLKLYGGAFVGDLTYHLTRLRWIFWSHPPETAEPISMQLRKVVVLQFSNNHCINDTNLQSLVEMAGSLKVLSLESCHSITRAPNFSGCLNLERLSFENCSDLEEIDGSIGRLKCLTNLKIDKCNRLNGLPEQIGDLVNLQHLFVEGSNVEMLPDSLWNLNLLNICLEFER